MKADELYLGFFQSWCLRKQSGNSDAVLGIEFSWEDKSDSEYSTFRAGHTPRSVFVSMPAAVQEWRFSRQSGILCCQLYIRLFIEFPAKCAPIAARVIADASRNTSGTGCWPTTPTMTAKEYSWTGSCFPPVASADAIPHRSSRKIRRAPYLKF